MTDTTRLTKALILKVHTVFYITTSDDMVDAYLPGEILIAHEIDEDGEVFRCDDPHNLEMELTISFRDVDIIGRID